MRVIQNVVILSVDCDVLLNAKMTFGERVNSNSLKSLNIFIANLYKVYIENYVLQEGEDRQPEKH